ncbi:MAG: hypothetical protein NC117_10565 [Pseudoflavonifractor sp.]|nr:hypothetical protein [Pseudoflavonifractor sp.]
MTPLYNLSISLYHMGARVAALRSGKVRTMLRGQRDAWQRLRQLANPDARYIWVHAASLGEFEQGRPLIEMIRRRQPGSKILLTFFSPSGYEVRCGYKEADIVVYLPFDHPANARRFLDAINIDTAIFIKYEFWGNYIHELHRRHIPTYLVSAIFRPSQQFFKPWGGMFRGILRCYEHIFVQDDASRQLLAGIGIDNVTVAGDTRFDRVTDIMSTVCDIPPIAAMTTAAPTDIRRHRATIVAGSTWPSDEELLIPYLNRHPDVKAVIAPHEVNAASIARIERAANGKTVRLSTTTPEEAASAQILIIDCYGKLSSAYRYGDIAYIGGGFGAGIHNINEAAVYDMPVLFGPRYSKFKEAIDLINLGGAFTVNSATELDNTLDTLIGSPESLKKASTIAGGYIRDNLGATKTVYNHVFNG